MRTLATATSKIINPTVTSLATIAVVILVQQIPLSQKLLWAGFGVLVAAVPTIVLYLSFRPGNSKVGSFWAPEGRDRIKAFLAWVVVALIYTVSAYLFSAPRLITALAVVSLALGIINLAAASYFKISVHSEIVTLLVLLGVLAVSVNLIYLTALIILVGWARVYLKEHTLTEVSFGILTTITLVFLIFSFFGLTTF
jgi:hypothetical protein